MRINARLDNEWNEKLTRLRRMTGKSTSVLLREAIDAYYRQFYPQSASPKTILEAQGFIACATAEPTLSTDYKQELTAILEKKHDHR